jgi:thiosulfate dehydrogenase (quinone) large subunit
MGLLRGRMEDYSSPLAGVPVRLYCGYFFLRAGLHKLTSGFGGTGLAKTLTEWATKPGYDFYRPFLTHVAIPHADVFAWLVMLGEIAVGAALLVGFASRLAALGGMFLCLNFLLAGGVPLLSAEPPVVFCVMLLTVFATAAGRALGLDMVLRGHLPRWAA